MDYETYDKRYTVEDDTQLTFRIMIKVFRVYKQGKLYRICDKAGLYAIPNLLAPF